MVEQGTHKPLVVGSIPTLATGKITSTWWLPMKEAAMSDLNQVSLIIEKVSAQAYAKK